MRKGFHFRASFAEVATKAESAGEKKTGFKTEKIWYSTHYCFPFSHFLFYGIGKNLVEKGILNSFNRFDCNNKKSWLNKFFLFPIKKMDFLNKEEQKKTECVNLVFKAVKK